MISLDGSHEAWLIYSDWLEDQDNDFCHQIRSDLEDEIENWNWNYDYRYYPSMIVGDGISYVGGNGIGSRVGCDIGVGGDDNNMVGGGIDGEL
jgi:hypothetical protein